MIYTDQFTTHWVTKIEQFTKIHTPPQRIMSPRNWHQHRSQQGRHSTWEPHESANTTYLSFSSTEPETSGPQSLLAHSYSLQRCGKNKQYNEINNQYIKHRVMCPLQIIYVMYLGFLIIFALWGSNCISLSIEAWLSLCVLYPSLCAGYTPLPNLSFFYPSQHIQCQNNWKDDLEFQQFYYLDLPYIYTIEKKKHIDLHS